VKPPRTAARPSISIGVEPASMYEKLNANQNFAAPSAPVAASTPIAAAIGSAAPTPSATTPAAARPGARRCHTVHASRVRAAAGSPPILEQHRDTDERAGREQARPAIARGEEHRRRADQRQHHEQLAVRGERIDIEQRRREDDPQQGRERRRAQIARRGVAAHDPGKHEPGPARR